MNTEYRQTAFSEEEYERAWQFYNRVYSNKYDHTYNHIYNHIYKQPKKRKPLKKYNKCNIHGAGVLFISTHAGETYILLGKRQSGVWSIAGGGADKTDKDNWATAKREAKEEFGKIPKDHRGKQFCSIKYKFGKWYEWETFVISLPRIPHISRFPDRTQIDFNEFSTAQWFPLSYLPRRMHWLMHPVIWNLRRQLKELSLTRNVHPLSYNQFAAA